MEPEVDPTVEFVSIEIEGKTYQMAFDLGSLAKAESEIGKTGVEVNLLRCLDFSNINLSGVRTLFACSLRRWHPDISYHDACNLVTHKTLASVFSALSRAWYLAMGLEPADLEKKVEAPKTETIATDPS